MSNHLYIVTISAKLISYLNLHRAVAVFDKKMAFIYIGVCRNLSGRPQARRGCNFPILQMQTWHGSKNGENYQQVYIFYLVYLHKFKYYFPTYLCTMHAYPVYHRSTCCWFLTLYFCRLSSASVDVFKIYIMHEFIMTPVI